MDTDTSSITAAPALKAIFGPGRSGTTWLGSIISTHPEVAYRFEPFHRRRDNPAIRRCRETLNSPALSDADLPAIRRTLQAADPLTDKPPFFRKANTLNLAKKPAWVVARLLPRSEFVYRALYTPRRPAHLVFKEVALEWMMRQLLEHTSVPLVYLVRNPWATVASRLKGQAEKKMTTGRYALLDSLLRDHDPALFERLQPRLPAMDTLEQSALLWRIDVEKGMAAVRGSPRAMLLMYEDLCDDTLVCTQRVCAHLGLDFPPEMRAFLEKLLTMPDKPRKGLFNSDLMNGYFTVYRNPGRQRDKWKKHLPRDDRSRITALLKDSAAFDYLAAQGGW